MSAILSYRGPADLTLIYGRAPGLARTAERPSVEVVVSRHTAAAPFSVLVGHSIGVDLLNGFDLTRAVVVLPDGTVVEGPVQEISGSGDYFEIASVWPASQGGRYA
ncbi:hypothetical protein H4C81_10490 [Pseudomonas monteilii]|uniref:hypothetical protein n=1 Tax=Pseudomonas monteilii TaxID=76759 RepID=UPI0015F79B76|nr:hypothetical protein [Pseudomonas monteilii]MBA6089321.1 hypothetical protein [Pseudomonas monteilii]